jgi:hypothetical protein
LQGTDLEPHYGTAAAGEKLISTQIAALPRNLWLKPTLD